jgi:carboxyl-terminal processing protease
MRACSARRLLPLFLFALILPFAPISAHGSAHASSAAGLGAGAGRYAIPDAAASPAAPAAIEQQANPLGIVREAFDLLYGGYIFPLTSDQLLADAWDGVNKALADAGLPAVERPPLSGNPDEDWNAFASAFRRVASNQALSSTALAYGAASQMATARNSCHTAFLPPELAAIENGAEAHQPTVDAGFVAGRENLLVYRIYPGGPADKAGLRPGDTLLSSGGLGSPRIVRRIFSTPADTPIQVTVQRPGVAGPITLAIVPEVTVIPFVRTALLPGNIGVIQWDDFTTGAGQLAAVRQALTDFESRGVTGWVLDLRTSPGGDAHTMAAIANLFIPTGKLATTFDRAGGGTVESAEPSAAFPVQRPLVVLTEKYSASAADILPGILQNNGRAYLIGETTDGCISSSRIETLSDGSALQVEVERVLIGRDDLDLDGIGVTPNETIVRTPEILAAGSDPQMSRAAAYLNAATGR